MPSDEPSRPYNWRPKSLAKLESIIFKYWFGSRLYDPLTARWTTQDPMSEKYYASSPYAYCQNDPVKYIDRKPPVKCVLRFCPISIRVGAISSEFVPMAWE